MLRFGRNTRKEQLKKFREDIPEISELIEKKNLNLEKWFNNYIKLINFGARQFKETKIEENKLKLRYTNYSNSKRKEFINYLPRRIKLDEDFQYFFGLWCGDRLGSGRFGVVNKNKTINFVTKNYLEKLYQKPEFILVYSEEIEKPKIDYVTKSIKRKSSVVIGNLIVGYAVLVGIKNSILFSFFDYLLKNMETFLNLLPNKNIFFAGLFDAEGNVFWEDRCFRWACKNKRLTEIYTQHLKELSLFHRYDGSNLVTYNNKKFRKEILPFIKHPEKINKANFLCYGKGNLDNRFLNILKTVKNNNGSINKDIAKVLKRVKMYSQLKVLERFGYIYKEDYPHKNYITMKGLRELQRGQGYI